MTGKGFKDSKLIRQEKGEKKKWYKINNIIKSDTTTNI